MQVIGFNFTKISSERKKALEGKIEISSNMNIKDISPDKIPMIKDKEVLKFDFEFIITYKPDLAEIKFEGFILVLVDREKQKDIIKKWKNKKLDDDVRIPLFNTILTKCNLRALQLEEELQLPSHVPMPKIQPQNNNKAYVQ
jgi:hypothetical protein